MSERMNHFQGEKTASGKVIGYIKNLVIYKKLRPGDRMPTEPELCELIGVSRTAVREAIKILQANGIVDVRQGDGTYISTGNTPSNSDTLLFRAILQKVSQEELADFRECIELDVIQMAMFKALPEDIERLKNNYDAMSKLVSNAPEDYTVLHEADMDFHLILADAAHNLLLKDTYLSIMDIYSPLILRNYESGQTAEGTYEAHRLTIEAITEKDITKSYCAARFTTDLCAKWIKKSEDFLYAE